MQIQSASEKLKHENLLETVSVHVNLERQRKCECKAPARSLNTRVDLKSTAKIRIYSASEKLKQQELTRNPLRKFEFRAPTKSLNNRID